MTDVLTPVSAFGRVVHDDEAGFLLESVEHGQRWGRFSFVGRRAGASLVARGTRVDLEGDIPLDIPGGEGVLAALEKVVSELRAPGPEDYAPIGDLPPLHAGVVGYLGYDVVREVERLGEPPPDDLGVPDALLSIIGDIVCFDHWRQRAMLVTSVLVPPGAPDLRAVYDAACGRVRALHSDISRSGAEPLLEPPCMVAREDVASHVERRTSRETFTAAVGAAKERIVDGDAFQVVLSQRFDVTGSVEPFDTYRVLRQVNPSPYMYFLRHPEVTLIGSSPEPMVQLLDGTVISRPIAGTRRRGADPSEDRRLAGELAEDPKELAEHVMLVDLARNDVGRVVEFGTETVDELMTLERYSHVMHLTSQVSGRLADGKGPIDVLRATLPAGTVSGAPKVSAMKIIDELEVSKRGPYAGVVGYLDFSGNIDTAIAIRTMVVTGDGRASVQSGAGIVADSDPESEDRECQDKAAALLSAALAARSLRDRSALR